MKTRSSHFLLSCGLFFFLWLFPLFCSAGNVYKIFIVHSYEAENVCGQPQEGGILEGLAEQGFTEGNNLLVKRFYMDTKRVHTTPEQIAAQGRAALAAIKKMQPDVVVTLDDNAARMVMLPLVDSEVPVVFSGINNMPEWYNSRKQFMNSRKRPGHNVTGVYEKLHMAKSLQVMKAVLPDLKRIVILVDDSPTGRAMQKQVAAELAGNSGDVLYSFRQAADFSEYKRIIRQINSNPDIGSYYPACSRLDDGARGIATVPEIIAWSLAHSTKPAMAVNYSFSRLGLFGGASVNFPAMGRQAALKIAAILTGTSAGNIPVEDAGDYAIVFNLARARQLGISIPVDLLGAADQVYNTMELGGPMLQPQVLIIHSRGKDDDEALLEQGIFHELEKVGWLAERTFKVQHYFLHTENISSQEQLRKRAAPAMDTVYRLKPDVVVVLGDAAATEIMLPLVDSGYPVIFGGVHAPLSYYAQRKKASGYNGLFPGANITGVGSAFNYVKTLEALHIMLPDAHRIVVVYSGVWPWLDAIARDFSVKIRTNFRRVGFPDIRFERVTTMEEFQQAIIRLDADPEVDVISAMLPVGLSREDGLTASRQQIFDWLFTHQNKPGFTFSVSGVRRGFLVSAATDPEIIGRQLGRQLIRVFAGDLPVEIPIERPTESGLFLNQARARQLGIQIPVDIFEAARQVYTTMEPVTVQ